MCDENLNKITFSIAAPLIFAIVRVMVRIIRHGLSRAKSGSIEDC